MIFAALLLAAAPAPALPEGPTVAETAATCRAIVRARVPRAELERILRDGQHDQAEAAKLRRECLLYIQGAEDALARVRPRG